MHNTERVMRIRKPFVLVPFLALFAVPTHGQITSNPLPAPI